MGAKVIILTHEFAPFRGGAATYAQEVAAALTRLGYEVELWAPDYGKRFENEVFPFSVVRLAAGGSLRFFDLIAWVRAVGRQRTALAGATVILASVGAHLALMILTALRSFPHEKIVSVLYGSEVLRFRRNLLWRTLARWFFSNDELRLVTISEFSKALIRKSHLVPNESPIFLARCAPSAAAASPGQKRSVADGRQRILTLARIDPRKGQLDVARALSLLPNDLRQRVVYQLAGCGDDAYRRAVKRACEKGGVAFEDLGEVPPNDLSAAYAQCDVYAMTSRVLPASVEGFGITYLEAGVQGKPVVAWRSGGAMEAVIEGETGLLVREGDLASLAQAFTRLLTSPQLRARLGAGGQRNAGRYSWETTARILLDSTCSSPSSPRSTIASI